MVGESAICSDSGSGSGLGSRLVRFGICASALKFRFSGFSFEAATAAAARILACASFSRSGAKVSREGDNIAGDVLER